MRIAGRVLNAFIWFLVSPAFRLLQIATIGSYDIVIIQKGVTRWFEYLVLEKLIIRLSHRLGKKVVYHFDDVIDDHLKPYVNYLIRNADVVITTNEVLVEYAQNLNKNVYLIPENIGGAEFVSVQELEFELPRPISIGWIGLGGGYKFEALEDVGDALEKIAREFEVKLVIASNLPFSFREERGIRVENRQWTLDLDSNFHCDIGINPVPYELAVKGKGSFKLIKYMAKGIPSVTSWTPDSFLKNGETCLVARNNEEWYVQIRKLITRDDVREHIMCNGINEARKYRTDVLGRKYYEIIST